MIGSEDRLGEALLRSEDSEKLNTSFVERLNLTIRQACAYLSRRALSHARASGRLADHIDLVRCWYNFLRPHRGLKFGKELRTPAMQAGVVSRKLSWSDVFPSSAASARVQLARVMLFAPSSVKHELRLAA